MTRHNTKTPLRWEERNPIAPNDIHLWYSCDHEIKHAILLSTYFSVLSAYEKKRYQRFYYAHDRHQYLITRAMVRNILSYYFCDIAPCEWVFGHNGYGKPYLQNDLKGVNIYFNLSHTKGMVILAVTMMSEIGIDVELPRQEIFSPELAKSICSVQEFDHFNTLSATAHKVDYFFDLWTLKEACVKMQGVGLSIPLSSVSFLFTNSMPSNIIFKYDADVNERAWKFYSLYLHSPHKVALAVETALPECSLSVRKIVPFKHMEAVDFLISKKN